MTIPVPENENERLEKLKDYKILDTAPEMVFDEITELAAEILGCPISFIQFMDEDRQWFKSKYGLPDEMVETPRDVSVCQTTICQNDLLLVPDCSKDERFAELPNVKGEPNLKFYAGMPLVTPSGHAVGTICCIDFEERDLTGNQKESIRRLSRQVVAQLELRRVVTEMDLAIKDRDKMHEELKIEKKRADDLLLNILPAKVANELRETDRVEPRYYGNVSILFSDFCEFTKLSENMEPKGLIDLLNQYFSAFDKIIKSNNIEKLKTIGDSYMCAAGLPSENRGHAIQVCLAAMEMMNYLNRANEQREKLRLKPWQMRVGINSGPVMSGVVGEEKFTYDIWGDSVNVASLMESYSEPGKINLSESTYEQVKEIFEVEDRGKIDSGKKGDLPMFFLKSLKNEFSDDGGLKPNDAFQKKFGSLLKVYE
ncbi:MAG: hypothetical protein CMM18_04210 [Rhodospirillaceae bacterium]|nr:hypothetical protein [Rhodospirillaceae bacterium]